MRVELLLELSGLSRQESLVIKACTSNSKSFEAVAAILVEHYSGVHLKEGRSLGGGTFQDRRHLIDEVISHCELSGASYLLVDDATTSRWAEASVPMQPLFGIGDISFYSNDQGLQDDFEGWCTNSYPYRPPLNFDDVFAQEFVTWVRQTAENQVATSLIAQAAFPSTENGDGGTFDQIESPQDFALMDPSEEAIIEETQDYL